MALYDIKNDYMAEMNDAAAKGDYARAGAQLQDNGRGAGLSNHQSIFRIPAHLERLHRDDKDRHAGVRPRQAAKRNQLILSDKQSV